MFTYHPQVISRLLLVRTIPQSWSVPLVVDRAACHARPSLGQVPTTFDGMFLFNAAVMGPSSWNMGRIMGKYVKIVGTSGRIIGKRGKSPNSVEVWVGKWWAFFGNFPLLKSKKTGIHLPQLPWWDGSTVHPTVSRGFHSSGFGESTWMKTVPWEGREKTGEAHCDRLKDAPKAVGHLA